jgi:hypothetical protein
MRSLIRTTLFLLLALGLVAGCGKNDPVAPGAASSDDQSQVEQAVAAHPEMAEDGVYGAEGSTALGADAPTGALAAIQPLSYWRRIASVDRRLVIDFRDPDAEGHWTTAVVTIHRQLHGTFNILTGDLPEDSTRSVVHKRLNDHWVRKVLLKRAASDDSTAAREDRTRWRIAGISGVEVTSKDATTQITSLRIQGGGLDTTVTDPLAFFRLRSILRFDVNTEITLTVTTLKNDDIVVLHHRDHRFRFHNNGDNTYTGVWSVGAVSGLQHVGVNALSHGTLYDDTAPYDSKSWILPYVVRPTEMADLAQ